MEQNFVGYLIIACGLFSMLGGLMDWDFFMNNSRARPVVSLIGRGGARVFYCLLGLGLGAFGAAMILGYVGR